MHVNRIKSTNRCFNKRRYNATTTGKIASIKKNYNIQKRNKTVSVKSFNNDIVTMSYFIGKGIVAFTFFYTSLNYFFYKGLREEYEEEKDEEKK